MLQGIKTAEVKSVLANLAAVTAWIFHLLLFLRQILAHGEGLECSFPFTEIFTMILARLNTAIQNRLKERITSDI